MANQYWFKPKMYGYGAVPSTWEGWALILGFALIIGASGFVIAAIGDGMTALGWIAWAVLTLTLTIAVVVISQRKTDGEWRWRGGKRGLLN